MVYFWKEFEIVVVDFVESNDDKSNFVFRYIVNGFLWFMFLIFIIGSYNNNVW